MTIDDLEHLIRDELKQKNIDVNRLLDLHAQVKSSISHKAPKSHEIAEVWAKTGYYMKRTGESETLELCMFMAHLYDRENFDYIDHLIQAYCDNEKYRQAVDFLDNLYQLADESTITTFWERITSILPNDRVLAYLHSSLPSPLEKIATEFNLDETSHLTWMMLGYTLKSLDYPILANQALDNALALKYFS